MATISRTSADREVDYPTSDGKPMGETDLHRQDMMDVIQVLEERFAADPNVYVTGNLLLFYERNNRRRHVSPDVFVVRGVPQAPPRRLLPRSGRNREKGPDFVIEITSKTTKGEDHRPRSGRLFIRDILKVPEYFQFDPREDYLKPPMQGHRLIDGEYVPIEPIEGRIPSDVLELHLERQGTTLRLYDPVTRQCLLTPTEGRQRAEAEQVREAEARQRAEAEQVRRGRGGSNAELCGPRREQGRELQGRGQPYGGGPGECARPRPASARRRRSSGYGAKSKCCGERKPARSDPLASFGA